MANKFVVVAFVVVAFMPVAFTKFKLVVEAVPKYPMPETVSAVLLAYGNVEATDVEVAVT